MQTIISLSKTIFEFRFTIWVLSIQEIRARYAGSLLGSLWNLINPMVMVTIYYMVFSVGFKVAPANDIPFLSWFFSAFVIWQIFNEAVLGGSNSLARNRNLIKKTNFPSQILPIIPIISATINSLILVGLLIAIMLFQGIGLSWMNFQAIYYLFGAVMLALGISWFFSAASILLRDLSHILNVILQVLFWATPIFYQVKIFPEKYQQMFLFNPIYYLTKGFRDSFLYDRYFWEEPKQMAFFWIVVLCSLIFGGLFFKKMKPEVADVI